MHIYVLASVKSYCIPLKSQAENISNVEAAEADTRLLVADRQTARDEIQVLQERCAEGEREQQKLVHHCETLARQVGILI